MLLKYPGKRKKQLLLLLGLALSTSPLFSEGIELRSSSAEITLDEDEFANLPEYIPHEDTGATTGDLPTDDETDPVSKKPLDPAEKEKAEQLLKKVMLSFEKISFSLESIALVLNHNQLRIKDKTPMMEEVMKLRSLTHMISASAITEINPEKIAHLVKLAQELIDHIRYLLTTDLMTFVPFDKKMLAPTRSALDKPAAPQTIEQLDATLQKTNSVLGKLETEAVNVGLNTFNILFRRMEKLNDDYKIVNKCLWGLGISATAAGLLFVLDPHYIEKIGGVFDKALQYVGLQSKPQEASPEEQIDSTIQSSGTPLIDYSKLPPIVSPSIDTPQTFEQTTADQTPKPKKALTTEDLNNFGLITRFFLRCKLWIGDPVIGKLPLSVMPEAGKIVGEGTRGQDLLTRTVPIITLGIPPISIFALLQPTLQETATNWVEWFRAKRAQLASFLRGGPIKKSLRKFERESKVNFDDIIGNEHAKMICAPLIEYIINPEPFDRGGTGPTNAKLFTGETRAGKTHFADAIYGEMRRGLDLKGDNRELLYLSLDAAQLKKYGITNVFMYARAHAPSIIFIDEIDKGRFQNDGDADALCELQVAMSELNTDSKNKVIVIAATNRPDNLDPSLRADGRFGDPIPFSYPSTKDRLEYFTRELTKRAAIIDEYFIEQLAYETEGANYDGLKSIIITAFQKAKMKGVILSWKELEEALDQQFHKMIFDEKTLPDKELLLVAAHLMAHAFTRIVLNPSLQVTKVTIRPIAHKAEEVSVIGEALSGAKKQAPEIIKYGEIFTAHKANAQKFDTYQDLISELKICLAGHVIEKILFGGTSFSYHAHDTEEAFDLAKRIAFNGMQEKNMPKAIKEKKLIEAYELVQKYESEVTELLTKHKEELIMLTNILFDEKTLPCDAIIGILKEIKKRNEEKKDENTDHNAAETAASDDLDSMIDLPNEGEIIDAISPESDDASVLANVEVA